MQSFFSFFPQPARIRNDVNDTPVHWLAIYIYNKDIYFTLISHLLRAR